MSTDLDASTALPVSAFEALVPERTAGLGRSLMFVVKMVSAGIDGARSCFISSEHEPSPTSTFWSQSTWVDSTTSLEAIDPVVRSRLEGIFGTAQQEPIEDGQINSISLLLSALVRTNAETVIRLMAGELDAQRFNVTVTAEAIKELGAIEDEVSRADRLWLLEHALFSASAYIRDAAGLGLASLGDASAIPHLSAAIARESIRTLADDLHSVIDELSSSSDHASPTPGNED